MAPLAPARPYRDFLTPALHKHFTDASFYTLLLCFFISVWMGNLDHYVWSWFPLGPAGIRALLLFIPALVVFILRVAQWHVGHRNTQMPAETFRKNAFRKATFVTIAGYAISAWFYSEVYIWTRSGNARLGFTDKGKDYERIRLNERPLYIRFMFFALALSQALVHLWHDYDKIDIPAIKPRTEREAPVANAPDGIATRVSGALLQQLRPLATKAAMLSVLTSAVGTVFYFAAFRYILWDYYYNLARHVVSLSRIRTTPTGLPPFFPLVLMFVSQGSLLALIWQFVNKAFDLYISNTPIKKDKPITSESKDPNGSLLNGLKSKKETVNAIALWELALITDRFPERRKTIYGELERKKAPTFQQVVDICLAEVRLLISRLNIALDPTFRPEDEAGTTKKPEPISLVPQIAQPLKDAPIRGPGHAPTTRLEKFGALTADIAKTHSSSQNVQNAYAREYLKKSQETITHGAKEVEAYSSSWAEKLIRSSIGWPFRYKLRRTVALIITGAPYSRISQLCNAITALSNLTVYSIKEDEFGRFQNVVPEIIRAFTTAIKKLDEYVSKVEPHWSDIDSKALSIEDKMNIPEVLQVRLCLRDGLERILGAFNEFLTALEMSSVEIRDAKKCVARAPEMAVAR